MDLQTQDLGLHLEDLDLRQDHSIYNQEILGWAAYYVVAAVVRAESLFFLTKNYV
jgi:hypothetical protein